VKDDLTLRRDVEAELEREPSVNAQRIGVAVENGIVTLTGEVTSYRERWRAERAVERVAGVRGIVNEIAVRPPDAYSEIDLAEKVFEALRWNTLVPDDRIRVKVEHGWVTLTGQVTDEYQRRAATDAVRDLPGVRGVQNLLEVRPETTAVPEPGE
jgi:osmotically-inducible protein OsmY